MEKQRKTLYENVQALRKQPATSSVGDRYMTENDKTIIKDALDGVPIDEIAKKQKRTISAVRVRIFMHAIEHMKLHNCSLEDVSRIYHVKLSLLSTYYQRVCEKEWGVSRVIREACLSPKPSLDGA